VQGYCQCKQSGNPAIPPSPSFLANARPVPRLPRSKRYDAGKKVSGRKRHITVNTLGLLLAVVVHPADVQDRNGLWSLSARLAHRFARLLRLIPDGGDAGRVERIVPPVAGIHLKVTC
jgi:hypothetical protein